MYKKMKKCWKIDKVFNNYVKIVKIIPFLMAYGLYLDNFLLLKINYLFRFFYIIKIMYVIEVEIFKYFRMRSRIIRKTYTFAFF